MSTRSTVRTILLVALAGCAGCSFFDFFGFFAPGQPAQMMEEARLHFTERTAEEAEAAWQAALKHSTAAHAVAREYEKLPDHIKEVISLGEEAKSFIREMYMFNLTPDETLAKWRERNIAIARRLAGDVTEEELEYRQRSLEHQYKIGELSVSEYATRLQSIAALYEAGSEERMAIEEKVYAFEQEALQKEEELRQRFDDAVAERARQRFAERRAEYQEFFDWVGQNWSLMGIALPGQVTRVDGEKVDRAGAEAADRILTPFEKLEGRMEMVGRGAIDGLIRGLMSGEIEMKDTVLSIITSIISMFAQHFIFASPSKLTERWGRNIVRGLMIGMEGERTALEAVSNRVFSIPTPSFPSPTVSPALAGAMGGTMSFRLIGPPIPPPKDPRQAARDREWQEFYRESAIVAEADGFRGRKFS